MGLLDSVIGAVTQNVQSGQGGNAGGLLQHVIGMLANNSGGSGGLGELVQSFEKAGLGNVVNSWVSTGHNLPISAEQLQQVVGSGKIAEIAQSLGLQPGDVAAQLSHILPKAVDHVTPNGQIPAGGLAHADIGSALTSLLGMLK
jgi:uncharacterized protein YidB (DUF937 family)